MKFIAAACKQLDRSRVVLFNLGNNLSLLIDKKSKSFNEPKSLPRVALASFLLDCNHNIDFSLVWFDPLGEEKIYVANHFSISIKDDESILRRIFNPGLMICILLFKWEQLWSSQIKQFWVCCEPRMVLLNVFPSIWLKGYLLPFDDKVLFFGVLLHRIRINYHWWSFDPKIKVLSWFLLSFCLTLINLSFNFSMME